jgi:replication factor C small subunit
MAAAAGKDITADVVYQAVSAARPGEVREALEMALQGNFAGARERLDALIITYGLAGEDILRQMHRTVRDLEIPDEAKVQLIEKLAEADFRLSEGATARIQIEAAIAHFIVVGRHIEREQS